MDIISMSRPRVYVTRRILSPAFEMLKEKFIVTSWNGEYTVPREILLKEVENVEALYCTLTDHIDEELLKRAKNLKVIATMSGGYDHINLAACKRRGILVANTPDIHAEACAEFAMAVILATTRRVVEANRHVHNGKWKDWVPMYMCGRGISGSVVGIVGMGKIGMSIAEKMLPFHPKQILYHNRRPNQQCDSMGATYIENLDELLSRCDFIIACLSLTRHTRHVFNAQKFAFMKPSAQFFNFGRGGLVDQDALYDALSRGCLLAAGADVCTPEPLPMEHKLLTLPNFVLLPHISSATVEVRLQMATLTSENIIAGMEKHEVITPVPFENTARFPGA